MKILGLVLLLIAPWAQAGDVLRVYGWSHFLPDATLRHFEKECQCRVVQDISSRGDEMVSHLQGGARYDVVFPPSLVVNELLGQKLLQPLDRSRLGNLRNVEPKLMNGLYDKGNVYTVPSSLALVSVGYNIEKFKQLGIDPYSWSVLFDPKVLSRLKGHVVVPERPREIFAAALFYLGRSPLEANDADYRRAAELIRAARPYWSVQSGGNPIRELAQGNSWLAMGYSSEMFQARELAHEDHRPFTIGNVLQKEGNQLAVDVMAVPANARRPDLAWQFINFMLDGRNAAELTNEGGAINAVTTALPFYREDLKVHPLIAPEGDALRRWMVLRPLSAKEMALVVQLWSDSRPLPLISEVPPHGGGGGHEKGTHVR